VRCGGSARQAYRPQRIRDTKQKLLPKAGLGLKVFSQELTTYNITKKNNFEILVAICEG
jgi:hypothetical protein